MFEDSQQDHRLKVHLNIENNWLPQPASKSSNAKNVTHTFTLSSAKSVEHNAVSHLTTDKKDKIMPIYITLQPPAEPRVLILRETFADSCYLKRIFELYVFCTVKLAKKNAVQRHHLWPDTGLPS